MLDANVVYEDLQSKCTTRGDKVRGALLDITIKYNNAKGYNVHGCLDPSKLTQSKYYAQVQYEIRNRGDADFIAPAGFVTYAACGTPAIWKFLTLKIEGGRDSSGNLYSAIELSRFATCVIDDSNTVDAASCVPGGPSTNFALKPVRSLGISQGGSYGVSKKVSVKFPLTAEQFNALRNSLPSDLTFTLSVNKDISPNATAGVVTAVDGSKLKDVTTWQATAEVSTLFVTTVTASLSDGLQLGYRFDSVSGSRVGNIASGSVVYDATLMNGATVSNNQLLLSAASSQYMSIGNFTTGTAGLTFATWYKSDNSGDYARIFDFGNGQDADNILLYKEGNQDRFTLAVLNPGQPNPYFLPDVSYKFNTGTAWKHVAWTLDPAGSGTLNFYINGVPVGSAAKLYPRSILRSNNYLGKSNWNNPHLLNGGLKDFRLYNRVLSAAEVSILFTSTNTN
eukprot:gene61773-biopygen27032